MEDMCEDIRQTFALEPADFILVSGDLAYSGDADDYVLVENFLDKVARAARVPRAKVFCIPGNHDIARHRQRFCFRGARSSLQDQISTDAFLGDPSGDDFKALSQREQSYREFQTSYCADQERTPTPDGLAYVARLAIDGVHLAIVGLDSAWLAEGGDGDHLKLLVGERQVIEALKLARDGPHAPHLVIAMAHHPLHLLQDFDRRPVGGRLEHACHFIHCGHLHQPEERTAGHDATGCLIVSAGASFENRQSANSFAVVTVNLLQGVREVCTHRYSYADGKFERVGEKRYRIEVQPTASCPVQVLADALARYTNTEWPHYLAAILLDKKSEVPMAIGSTHAMVALAALDALPDGDAKQNTIAMVTFRNALRVLYGREDLDSILATHGGGVRHYSALVAAIATRDPAIKSRLEAQEIDSRVLAASEAVSVFGHRAALLSELAAERDWEALREQAARHLDAPDRRLATQAKRLLALALAHSEQVTDKRTAMEMYRRIADGESPEPTDAGNLIILLTELGSDAEAKTLLLKAIATARVSELEYYEKVGQQIVTITGDRDFRERLSATIAERGRQ